MSLYNTAHEPILCFELLAQSASVELASNVLIGVSALMNSYLAAAENHGLALNLSVVLVTTTAKPSAWSGC